MKYVTGIGSRETPQEVGKLIIDVICPRLIRDGYILRSGGADGADSYFEMGYIKYHGEMDIYLPWKGFNNNPSNLYIGNSALDYQGALDIASKYHPRWNYLTDGARKLHTRNVFQILGRTLDNKSDVVICWTPDGCTTNKTTKDTGGTGQAIRIAYDYGIPIKNLRNNI